MTTELLIFVGYGQDAKEQALAVCELKSALQETLKHLNQVASPRSTYSTIDFFNWESDAAVGIGGQSFAVTPHLERAAIAVFVFKERVGPVTWEELNNCRSRPIERRIPTFALFPNEPPAASRLTDREVARSWADLLDRRNELTEDWTDKESQSVTPLEPYRDKQHLKEILMKRVSDLLPSLIVPNPIKATLDFAGNSASYGNPDGNYLDSIAAFAQCDPKAIEKYRSLLRRDSQLSFPSELADDDFLIQAGYLRSGRPTVAAALLFGRLPSKVIPSALIRCSKYDGDNKATSRDWHNCDGPLLDQILGARDFIADNIRRREMPVGSSMQSTISYEYPMVCIREILANAVCHRNYEDQERLIYVTLFSNRIEIKSPGNWVSSQVPQNTPQRLSSLIRESVQRNMRLAHAISSVGMMEVEGSGIPTAVSDCADCGAPEPSVESRDGYVVVTIYPRDDWELNFDVDTSYPVIPINESVEAPRNSNRIVGDSAALKNVLLKIEQVAPTNSTVLITGESGTGKELVARAIHDSSPRKSNAFVAINCAALSETLIESELFGHEKGAFPGAIKPRIGRFELANGGTVFLDEFGELDPRMQVKLLRVLQEREFERVGGTKTIQTDVRIIAATNRDMEEEVATGGFRQDLWYRLNVVAIWLPPLRHRTEDIPMLVTHFVKFFEEKFSRKIEIPQGTMQVLQNYSWPGNVRELRNVLERAVVLSEGITLSLDSLGTRIVQDPPRESQERKPSNNE